MFSHRELPLDVDTLEYGWLVEVIVGDVTGRLTSSHVSHRRNFIAIVHNTQHTRIIMCKRVRLHSDVDVRLR